MITIYGIKNCDKCRKAIKWFESRDAEFRFHDLRADGLTANQLRQWQKAIGTGTLLNRRSQTWRQIPAGRREDLDAAGEQRLAIEFPTVIQRPVVAAANTITIGLDEQAWKTML
jgi:Spx/MgsR family transcriptional regulator